jgi:hypothetical protein
VVGAEATDAARRGAEHGARLAVPDALGRRARANVERILQAAGDGAVVFGRDEQHRVGGTDALAEDPPGFGHPFPLEIGIVQRQVAKPDEIEVHGIGREAGDAVRQLAAEGVAAKASNKHRDIGRPIHVWLRVRRLLVKTSGDAFRLRGTGLPRDLAGEARLSGAVALR